MRQSDPVKAGTGRGLGGWQRLWVAVAVISLAAAVAIIVADWQSGDAWIRDVEGAAQTRVRVEGIGDVDFPATMSAEAIALVTRAGQGNAEAIRAGIRAWGAELRKALDVYATEQNRAQALRVLGFWAAGVTLLYLAGWMAGWVWRGFRA